MTSVRPGSGPEVEFDPTLLALTVEEAARRLSVGRTTMYALIREGAVETVPIGRLRRVPVKAISAYLDARMKSVPSPLPRKENHGEARQTP